MRKLLVTAIASLALVSGSLLVANRAEAGGIGQRTFEI